MTLTAEQKAFVIKRLAAFYAPSEIAADFLRQWRGMTAQTLVDAITGLDPVNIILGPDESALFHAERARVLDNMELAAPFVQQKVRLLTLSRLARKFLDNNQAGEARAVFRQIAEEQGIGAGSKGKTPDGPTDLPVVSITRTIVYPTAPAEVAPE